MRNLFENLLKKQKLQIKDEDDIVEMIANSWMQMNSWRYLNDLIIISDEYGVSLNKVLDCLAKLGHFRLIYVAGMGIIAVKGCPIRYAETPKQLN